MTTVATYIADAKTYAAGVAAQADTQFSQMRLDIANIGSAPIVTPGTANLPEVPEIPDTVNVPDLPSVTMDLPPSPDGAPDLLTISPIEVGTIPQLTANIPTLMTASLPSQIGEFNVSAPSIDTSYTFPTVPDSLDVAILAPTLVEHATPTAPTISLPSLNALAPAGIDDAPTNLSDQFVAQYRALSPELVSSIEAGMDAMLLRYNPRFHVLKAAIDAQLDRYLDGGTGLDATVEDAIYERSRTKQNSEARRAADAAFDQMAGRGWTVPGASVAAGIRASRQAAADNNAVAAREIVVMQAEMEQKNLQFAVSTGATMHNAALSAALSYYQGLISINGMALDGAKALVGFVVEAYNLTLRAYEARLGAYRTEAAIYETQLKAAMADLDRYRAELEGVKTLTDIDQNKITMYRTQIAGQEGLANIFKTRVEAIVSEAGLERLKLDLYKAQAEGFAITAQIKQFEYKAFEALMAGNEQLVKVYQAEVDAYNARLSGVKIRIDAESEVVRAQTAIVQSQLSAHESEVRTYGIRVQAEGDVARVQLENQRQIINAVEVQNKTTIARTQLAAGIYEAQSRIIIEQVKMDIEALLRSAELRIKQLGTIAEMGTSSGKVYGDMAGSALAGMNSLVAQTLAE